MSDDHCQPWRGVVIVARRFNSGPALRWWSICSVVPPGLGLLGGPDPPLKRRATVRQSLWDGKTKRRATVRQSLWDGKTKRRGTIGCPYETAFVAPPSRRQTGNVIYGEGTSRRCAAVDRAKGNLSLAAGTAALRRTPGRPEGVAPTNTVGAGPCARPDSDINRRSLGGRRRV